MSRKPQYTRDSKHRIVSIANGFWRLQHRELSSGTKTVDPWMSVGPSMDEEAARAALRSRDKASSVLAAA
jgi:hypothetical protein